MPMSKLEQLKKDREDALAKANALWAKTKDERFENEADGTAFDAAMADVERLDKEIAVEQKAQDGKARLERARQGAGPRTVPANGPARQAPPRVTGQRVLADEDPARGFRSQRDFFFAVLREGMGLRTDERLVPLRATAGSDEQGEFASPLGGFLVPEAYLPNLMQITWDGDPTAGRTTQVPMGGPSVSINARTDKDHTTSVSGGLRFFRRNESDAGNPQQMKFEQIHLQANPLMGLSFMTEELLADSPISFAALIEAGFRDELAAKILEEKIRGTGAGEYLGVLNSPAKISVAKQANQTAKTIVYDNVVNMRAQAWGYQRAIWLANQDAYPQLSKLALPVGVAGSAMYQNSLVDDRPDMLLGRPIFYTEFCETLGTEGDLILCDWSQYLEGQLQGPQAAESIHVRFDRNERCFRVTLRNDGKPWWRVPLTPRKSQNKLSPIVTLAAR